jgi:hypothetical protein
MGGGGCTMSVKRKKAYLKYVQATPRKLAPSAREWFAILSAMRRASRPVLAPAQEVDVRGYKIQIPAVYGPPTFRNVINEEGEHV